MNALSNTFYVKKIVGLLLLGSFPFILLAQADGFTAYDQAVPGIALKFKMVPVKGGQLLLGSPPTEKNRGIDEGPQKKVVLSSFWMAAFETSRDAFDAFYKDENTPQNTADAVTPGDVAKVRLALGKKKAKNQK